LRRLQSVYTIAEKRIPKKINIQNDKLQWSSTCRKAHICCWKAADLKISEYSVTCSFRKHKITRRKCIATVHYFYFFCWARTVQQTQKNSQL
jgi:hypothetical protein